MYQQQVVYVLGILPLLLSDLQLNVSQVCLQVLRILILRLVCLLQFYVHASRIFGIFPFDQVTPVVVQVEAEVHVECAVVPEQLKNSEVFSSLVFEIVKHLLPEGEVFCLGHQGSLVAIADVFDNALFP